MPSWRKLFRAFFSYQADLIRKIASNVSFVTRNDS